MRGGMIAIVVLAAVLRGFGGCVAGNYNQLVTGKEAVANKWAQVDNQLQRRGGLIGNLVESVKGVAVQEQEVFGQIADARAAMAGARSPQAGIAVLLRPWTARSEPSFAEVRWAIEPIPSAERSRLGKRCLRVDILRMRGGQKGDSMFLEIDDATGSVRAFPSLAFAAHRADSTG